MLGISELALLLIVVIVVIGAKKLPELVRSMGKSARIFKSEAKAMASDDDSQRDRSGPRVIQAQPGDVISSRTTDTEPGNGSGSGGTGPR
ncbi:twin-arginine translocase TatA/TatE family subunit [Streptomyces sp. 5-10]|uniref:twin-arginine translocase TatA/TatE family subunit n=1 Tax=Streptomyces sp. 5-10 TaxID=878925 RepID=UPI00168A7F09|nr:twin-arginine translocase TatA/TatE family subunit [Streptomyces sp. 5-10]MBD3008593.1 twin-arginine translocase TatA/TatE family subunit [Streptomyces sp. 5-10]